MELLRELHAAGTTVVVITHDREIAAGLPRQVEMRDGRVVHDSSPAVAAMDRPTATADPGRGCAPADVRRGSAAPACAPGRCGSFLSALGIAIGIAAMVAVVGISSSSREPTWTGSSAALGTNLLTRRARQHAVRRARPPARRRDRR